MNPFQKKINWNKLDVDCLLIGIFSKKNSQKKKYFSKARKKYDRIPLSVAIDIAYSVFSEKRDRQTDRQTDRWSELEREIERQMK